MSDFREEIYSQRGGLKNLLSKVPGFKGYIEKEDRRTADKMLREAVANRYQEVRGRLSAIQSDFVDRGKLGFLDDLESVGTKLQTFIDRTRRASYGASGIFSAIKVDQAKLDQIYEYDNMLLAGADAFESALETLEFAEDDEEIQNTIRSLNDLARKSVQDLSGRKEVITGGAASGE